MGRITLLTDFGTRDGYVGAMKGVVASIVPGVVMDDVGHDAARGDPTAASYALGRYWNRYPSGVVHLVVVDPGVGTDRRGLAMHADGRFVVAPDNGVVTRVLEGARSWAAVNLTNPRYLDLSGSQTFHGRDVFAPAAAHLARGLPLTLLGSAVTDPVRLPEPEPERIPQGIRGVVVAVDRFGNLVTNLPGRLLTGIESAELDGQRIRVAGTYGEVASGEPLVLVNSDDRVEVAVRDGSAAETLGVGEGARVELPASPPSPS